MKGMKLFFCAITCGLAATASAQQATQPGAGQTERGVNQRQAQNETDRGQATTTTRGAGRAIDAHVADCLILGNQEEIATLRLAEQHSQNEQVKQLAQQMIRDHEGFVQKLQQFSGRPAVALDGGAAGQGRSQQGQGREANREPGQGAQASQSAQDRNQNQSSTTSQTSQAAQAQRQAAEAAEGQQRGPGGATSAVSTGDSDIADQVYQMQHKVAQECLKLTTEALKEHQGAEFDKAFVGQQMGAHIGMLAKLNAAESSVSGELQALVREGQETTKRHKEHLKQLKEQMSSERGQNNEQGNQSRQQGQSREQGSQPQQGNQPRRD